MAAAASSAAPADAFMDDVDIAAGTAQRGRPSSPLYATSFTDLLAGGSSSSADEEDDGEDAASGREYHGGGAGVPKFKFLPPPSLPLSLTGFSPSSFFAAGLSPSELLDSPVLLTSHNILPSPTTGSIPAQAAYSWKEEQERRTAADAPAATVIADFSFQPDYQQPVAEIEEEPAPRRPQKQDHAVGNVAVREEQQQQQQQQRIRSTNDGYNWRKYGQKQVKGSENPRSYYKCTHPGCPTKKKVEHSPGGQVAQIVYKGAHNHPKPLSTRRNSSTSSTQSLLVLQQQEGCYPAAGEAPPMVADSGSPDNSSVTCGAEDGEPSYHQSDAEDEPDVKRWKEDEAGENDEGSSGAGTAGKSSSAVASAAAAKEPKVVLQTLSDIDILDDGYRWRKYGQKVVKGNPNPRSYYKCTTTGCPVRKHIERASHDKRAVITTYEGKHNHQLPVGRGGSILPAAVMAATTAGGIYVFGPPAVNGGHGNAAANFTAVRPLAQQVAPYSLEMLQESAPGTGGGRGFGDYDSSVSSFVAQLQRAKEEPHEEPHDDMFVESLLC